MPGARRLNVFERHSPSGMFRVNRTAQEAVAVKDANFSEVTRIIADGPGRLTDLTTFTLQATSSYSNSNRCCRF